MRVAAAAFATLIGVAASAAAGNGAVHGPSKCSAQKLKAFGAYQQQIAGCRSKAVAKGVPTDEPCVAKAVDKLTKAFAKAEKKDDCLETGDANFVVRQGAESLDRGATVLENHAICCEIDADECIFVTADRDCLVSGGTLGSIGSVCGPAGNCVAPPPPASQCCQGSPEFGNGCTTDLPEKDCVTGLGGTYFPSATCEPTGACVVGK